MGILRTFLALCIVGVHTEPFLSLGPSAGILPVRCFYVISGFYMALVLTEKYSSALPFYKARLLRLLPMYWAALGITIALGYTRGFWDVPTAYDRIPVGVAILTTFSNALLIGQDWLYFIGKGYESTTIVGQAWTLSLEITFYAIAPLFVRARSATILLTVFGAFLLKQFAAQHGLWDHPWDYRFFPFELPYFLLGMLAYRFYAFAKPGAGLGIAVSVGLIAVTTLVEQNTWYFHNLYLACVTIAVPFIFAMTKDSKADAVVGELSYPIYITHMIFVSFFYATARDSALGLGVGVAAMSIALSAGFILAERLITAARLPFRSVFLRARDATARTTVGKAGIPGVRIP